LPDCQSRGDAKLHEKSRQHRSARDAARNQRDEPTQAAQEDDRDQETEAPGPAVDCRDRRGKGDAKAEQQPGQIPEVAILIQGRRAYPDHRGADNRPGGTGRYRDQRSDGDRDLQQTPFARRRSADAQVAAPQSALRRLEPPPSIVMMLPVV
jgi:hypothetical protein